MAQAPRLPSRLRVARWMAHIAPVGSGVAWWPDFRSARSGIRGRAARRGTPASPPSTIPRTAPAFSGSHRPRFEPARDRLIGHRHSEYADTILLTSAVT